MCIEARRPKKKTRHHFLGWDVPSAPGKPKPRPSTPALKAQTHPFCTSWFRCAWSVAGLVAWLREEKQASHSSLLLSSRPFQASMLLLRLCPASHVLLLSHSLHMDLHHSTHRKGRAGRPGEPRPSPLDFFAEYLWSCSQQQVAAAASSSP